VTLNQRVPRPACSFTALWPFRFVTCRKIGQNLAYVDFGGRVKCVNFSILEYVTELYTGCFMAHGENFRGPILELFLKLAEQRCIHVVGYLGNINELYNESV
jgi:hypothetical protein